MTFLESLRNLDLISVGISVAGIAILGFVVFFSNRKSITNRTFLIFAFVAILWSISNYLIYRSSSPELILLITRFHMFFSTWYSFFIFQLFYVFPEDKKKFHNRYKSVLLPIVIFTSILTLTPLVLSKIAGEARAGEVAVISPGPGIAVFGVVVVALIGSGIAILIKKLRKTDDRISKAQYKFILWGAAITFSLHLIFNFIFPIVLTNPRFVPLGAVFTFPFAAFTAYAIFKHHLLNIKVVTTEVVAFLLAIATLFEVIVSNDPLELALRFGVFLLILSFGILLIKSVLREVEQREQLEILNKQIAEKNVQLEELSRFKTQLLSLASHQVKAPLATIKQFATILMEGLYGPVSTKVKETIGKMKFSADELINLVNSLLDLRKVEEGKMEYQFAKIDFVKMVRGVVGELRPLAEAKKLELNFASSVGEAWVNADEPKLKQVVQNLVDNAIKYTPSGFVKVEIKDMDGFVIAKISDSGLGISKQLLPHLFEEFIRDERVKKEIKGTGLGLFIAKKIVEAHAGELFAESDGEGKGSRFFVKLRKA